MSQKCQLLTHAVQQAAQRGPSTGFSSTPKEALLLEYVDRNEFGRFAACVLNPMITVFAFSKTVTRS
jgi:hypothetical protein